jgi:hypothetical protein
MERKGLKSAYASVDNKNQASFSGSKQQLTGIICTNTCVAARFSIGAAAVGCGELHLQFGDGGFVVGDFANNRIGHFNSHWGHT